MTPQEKVKELQSIIREKLNPLINSDYVLLDLPYHHNVGDTLIWQGELDYLKSINHKCLVASSRTSKVDLNDYIKKDTIIIFSGGGNFGDIWPGIHKYRKQIITEHPNNRVIIFPQSIGYLSPNCLQEDSDFFSRYQNVTICVRDIESFAILDRWFSKNKKILVPDMAFMINANNLKKDKIKLDSVLFAKRNDKEYVENLSYSIVPQNADVKDWICESNEVIEKEIRFTRKIAKIIDSFFGSDLESKVYDFYWQGRYKRYQINSACSFVSPYEVVFSTRLHVVILSIILGKRDIKIFDNSYGKLSSFYKTWLKDIEGVELV